MEGEFTEVRISTNKEKALSFLHFSFSVRINKIGHDYETFNCVCCLYGVVFKKVDTKDSLSLFTCIRVSFVNNIHLFSFLQPCSVLKANLTLT